MGSTFLEKVVLITGGASGIGAAMANSFISEGARVVSFDTTVPKSRRGVRDVLCDVRNDAAVSQALTSVAEGEGRLNVVVHSAGIQRVNSIANLSHEDLECGTGNASDRSIPCYAESTTAHSTACRMFNDLH